MILENKKILIVEDDLINIDIMANLLQKEKCIALIALDGEKGLDILEAQPDISAVLLDWNMPRMNGIEMLVKIKQIPEMAKIPIIMQTSKTDTESIVTGIKAGAYYYLTKPYDKDLMFTILKRAVAEYENYNVISKQVLEKQRDITPYLASGEIRFRTVEEGQHIASWFSGFTRDDKISHGLAELLINAVEHGNLEIGYEKKTEFLLEDILGEEVSKRLKDPKYLDRYVKVCFKKLDNILNVSIEDMGDGFDFVQYLEINPERVFDLHGRGIAIANKYFLNGILYRGNGNRVDVEVNLK